MPLRNDNLNRSMLVISSAHIPEHTAEALGDLYGHLEADLFHALVYTPWSNYGWIFWAEQEQSDDLNEHPELANLLQFAKENGYHYLQLDCDADTLSDQPTFDW